MRYRKIGHSDVTASAITMGAMAIGGGTWWRFSQDEPSLRTIDRALELGVTTIDTAPIYGCGHSEELIGKAISGRRDKFVLSTKATFDWDTGVGRYWNDVDGHKVYVDHSYAGIKKDCENSLKRLGTDYIDIYYTHNPAKEPEKYPVSETVRAMMDLKKEGKIRCIGASNMRPEQVEEYLACGAEIDILQHKYSMLTRGVEETLLPLCAQYGMTFHAYSTLERGLLTGKVKRDKVVPPGDAKEGQFWWAPDKTPHAVDFVDGLQDICKEYGCTCVDLAEAFLYAKADFINVIHGAHKPEQIETAATAVELKLRADTVAEIRRRLAVLEAQYG